MLSPNFLIQYVANSGASSRFYADLLSRAPVESSPTFVMFALDKGLMLGLWETAGVQPTAPAHVDGAEIAFVLESDAAVDACFVALRDKGVEIAQTPLALDFGYTFVALDPDGHRLRMFAPHRQ
jgi:hypothetical protein